MKALLPDRCLGCLLFSLVAIFLFFHFLFPQLMEYKKLTVEDFAPITESTAESTLFSSPDELLHIEHEGKEMTLRDNPVSLACCDWGTYVPKNSPVADVSKEGYVPSSIFARGGCVCLRPNQAEFMKDTMGQLTKTD